MLLLVWFRQILYCSKCFLNLQGTRYSTILSIQNLKSKQTHITGKQITYDFNNVHILETRFQRKKCKILETLCCGGCWPCCVLPVQVQSPNDQTPWTSEMAASLSKHLRLRLRGGGEYCLLPSRASTSHTSSPAPPPPSRPPAAAAPPPPGIHLP